MRAKSFFFFTNVSHLHVRRDIFHRLAHYFELMFAVSFSSSRFVRSTRHLSHVHPNPASCAPTDAVSDQRWLQCHITWTGLPGIAILSVDLPKLDDWMLGKLHGWPTRLADNNEGGITFDIEFWFKYGETIENHTEQSEVFRRLICIFHFPRTGSFYFGLNGF